MYYINGYPRARIKRALNEEELLNLAVPAVPSNDAAPETSDAKSLYGPEPEGPRHRPREPTVAVLSRLTSVSSEILPALISHLRHAD